jgi:hypothetical protein
MPSDLKDRIEAAAVVAHRSINAELVARLEDSFRPPLAEVPSDELVAELVRRGEISAIEVRTANPKTP